MTEDILDVSGFRCPLPVLKASKALRSLPPGTVLVVQATDPMTQLDIPNFCREAGHELLSATEQNGLIFLYRIRRGADRL